MKIHYVTGSRADFGLMSACLKQIDDTLGLDLGLVATGQHLLAKYGNTIEEVRGSGIPLVAEIPVVLSGSGGGEMALAFAAEMEGFVQVWQKNKPDLVLVLGDRGEMLAASLAAVHLGIHVAHIHGGERSGTLDESFRHSISKLAHYHLPATLASAERLVRMGEVKSNIHVIGAPGLCDLVPPPKADRAKLLETFGLREELPVALVVFHPVVQEQSQALDQVVVILESLDELNFTQLILSPNSDAGGRAIYTYLENQRNTDQRCILNHLSRQDYLQAAASCDVVVGNSSSGIIETASLNVRCLNIGSRQKGRERNSNTIDCSVVTPNAIREALRKVQKLHPPFENTYGDGQTDKRLTMVLSALKLEAAHLHKMNSY